MKFLPIILLITAFIISDGNAGSPSEPQVCTVVAQVIFEFTSFTYDLLQLYILNLPRSDVASSDEMLDGFVAVVERSADVPQEDKKLLQHLVNHEDKFGGRSLADQLTRANIWDCFVGVSTGALDGILFP